MWALMLSKNVEHALLRDCSQLNYAYKRRWVGSPKMLTFCQCSYHRKCQHKAVGGQKKPKTFQRSL